MSIQFTDLNVKLLSDGNYNIIQTNILLFFHVARVCGHSSLFDRQKIYDLVSAVSLLIISSNSHKIPAKQKKNTNVLFVDSSIWSMCLVNFWFRFLVRFKSRIYTISHRLNGFTTGNMVEFLVVDFNMSSWKFRWYNWPPWKKRFTICVSIEIIWNFGISQFSVSLAINSNVLNESSGFGRLEKPEALIFAFIISKVK